MDRVKLLRMTRDHWEQMHQHVSRTTPEEACGLLAGQSTSMALVALKIIPVDNLLHSPVRFRMEPSAQLAAFNQIEEQRLELVGIYHSHPMGPATPSQTDLTEAYYPDAAQLIWSASQGGWKCRAFFIQMEEVTEISIEVLG